MKVTATEFERNFGHYRDAAQHAPVTITLDGHDHAVLISAALFEILSRGRIARTVAELDDETIAAIARAEVPAEYAYLDDY